jgi:transglutaminase-like putative cysteine protease
MAKFRIQHLTRYKYEVPVRDSANQIMLYPIPGGQEVVVHQLEVTANPMVAVHIDIYGNKVGTFTHPLPHKELLINSRLEVITTKKVVPEDNFGADHHWNLLKSLHFQFPFIEFLRLEQFGGLPELKQIMGDIADHTLPLQRAKYFCKFVFDNFAYSPGITTVETTLDEIWKLKSGVCQDFAHILLAMLRLNGIPARYVSGYICPHKNGMRGEGATHAWVEAFIPEYGWLGLDPTNNCIANDNHVRLAIGKNYYDCSPVRGTYRGISKHTLEVAVTVGYDDEFGAKFPEPQWEEAPSLNKNSFKEFQEKQMQQQ